MSLQLPGDDEGPPQELLELPEADDGLDLADLMRGLIRSPRKGGARLNPSPKGLWTLTILMMRRRRP